MKTKTLYALTACMSLVLAAQVSASSAPSAHHPFSPRPGSRKCSRACRLAGSDPRRSQGNGRRDRLRVRRRCRSRTCCHAQRRRCPRRRTPGFRRVRLRSLLLTERKTGTSSLLKPPPTLNHMKGIDMTKKAISTAFFLFLTLGFGSASGAAETTALADPTVNPPTGIDAVGEQLLEATIGGVNWSCVGAVALFTATALILGPATGGAGLAIAGAYAPIAVVLCE